jgi:hypothetical protein
MEDDIISAPCMALIVIVNLCNKTRKHLSFGIETMRNNWKDKKHCTLTVWSSAICNSDGSLIIDMIGIMNAYDPPMTVGSLLPNRVWSIVFIPVTNTTV